MEHGFVMQAEAAGSGRPVVLVPGGLTGWASWKPHAERLSREYRTVRVQLLNVDMGLRGQRLPDDYSVSTEVGALAAALDAQGLAEVDIAAWSFGAEVSLSFAIANPHRVRSLTLIEPPAFWVLRAAGSLSPDIAAQQVPLAAMWRADITEEQLAWFAHFAGFVPPDVDPRTAPPWPAWVAHRQSLAHGDAAYRHEDDIARVRKFPGPVLLFKSSDSSDFLVRIVDILGRQFPHAVVHDLPGGHALHVVGMEEFLNRFTAFLRGT